MSPEQYDGFAQEYAADEDNAFNALYERPTTLTLLGPVNGKRVLDAGCGAGALCSELLARGANVIGIDGSREMLAIAQKRIGAKALLLVGDLARPLAFSDASFDLVVASLVMHYLEEWEPPLREFARILAAGGGLVISTHHPTMDWQLFGGSYFAQRKVVDTWTKAGRQIRVAFWRRPLAAMVAAFRATGFVIEDIREPMPLPACKDAFPQDYEKLTTTPQFLFFRLRKPA